MQSYELSGWALEQSLDMQTNSFEGNPVNPKECVYQAVNKLIERKTQRSYSLCQKRESSQRLKSNLIYDKENQIKSTAVVHVNDEFKQCNNDNRINELKKLMDFLQHNEHYQLKYDTHRTYNKHDPKYQPEHQQYIDDKKTKLKSQLTNQKQIFSQQEHVLLQKLNMQQQHTVQQHNQQQLYKNYQQMNISNQNRTINVNPKLFALPPKPKKLYPLTDLMNIKQNNDKVTISKQIEINNDKAHHTTKLKFPKFIIQQQVSNKHCKTDAPTHLRNESIPKASVINRIFSNKEIYPREMRNIIYTPKTQSTINQHFSYDAGITIGTDRSNGCKSKQSNQ